jgi:alpha-tubulin suppressor-like RCC1 family protein
LALPEIAATHKNASDQLINVKVVYAGNNSSFAILDNGDLVSWGANGKGFDAMGYDDAYGQLGNGVLPAVGTTANQTSAGYVKVPVVIN